MACVSLSLSLSSLISQIDIQCATKRDKKQVKIYPFFVFNPTPYLFSCHFQTNMEKIFSLKKIYFFHFLFWQEGKSFHITFFSVFDGRAPQTGFTAQHEMEDWCRMLLNF